MALHLEPWFLQAVDKLRHYFLWAASDEAHGGCCTVAWDLVCQPKHLGGLGFHNICLFNTALCTRWLWLQKSDAFKPWQSMDLPESEDSKALFHSSVWISVGSGSSVLFEEDA
jgi:hypothetical protein